MKLIKSPSNPILSANPNQPWENLVVLNPGVIFDEKKQEFMMLYRAAGKDKKHLIHLGLATSKDGIHFKRKSKDPVLSPDENNSDGGCIEDPRITQMDDWFYVTYASRPFAPGQYWKKNKSPKQWVKFPSEGPSFLKKNDTLTHLAITQDFRTFKKLGRITDSRVDDRDVIIFPEKINGKFVRLSRPMSWYGHGYPNQKPATYIAYSDDLMEWSNPKLLMEGKEWWESKKIGGSCPPIKTQYGWFHIYHGVAEKDGNYRVGAVLLDLKNPSMIIARTRDFIMEPELPHELNGYYNGCVFPTGNVVRDETLYVYYGGADKFVCVATANFKQLIDKLRAGKL